MAEVVGLNVQDIEFQGVFDVASWFSSLVVVMIFFFQLVGLPFRGAKTCKRFQGVERCRKKMDSSCDAEMQDAETALGEDVRAAASGTQPRTSRGAEFGCLAHSRAAHHDGDRGSLAAYSTTLG